MASSVARKLYQSLQRGEPHDPDWFDEALTIATTRQIGLDRVIWEAVRELLDQVEREDTGEVGSDSFPPQPQ